jgi:hypothetical protein
LLLGGYGYAQFDFSPLCRSTIGFGPFDLAESAQRASEDSHPTYNIERLGGDRYQISIAVAGFSPDKISVTAEHNVVGRWGRPAVTPLNQIHLDPIKRSDVRGDRDRRHRHGADNGIRCVRRDAHGTQRNVQGQGDGRANLLLDPEPGSQP